MEGSGRYGMDAATARHLGIMQTTARRLNDELTILMSDIVDSLVLSPPPDPARVALIEMQSSLQRCAWLVSGMLNYAMRQGARPSAADPERLMEAERHETRGAG